MSALGVRRDKAALFGWGGGCAAPALDENVEDISGPVDRAPKIVLLAADIWNFCGPVRGCAPARACGAFPRRWRSGDARNCDLRPQSMPFPALLETLPGQLVDQIVSCAAVATAPALRKGRHSW